LNYLTGNPLRGFWMHAVRDRIEVERLLDAWRERHPDVEVTVLRACWPIGPTFTSQVVRYFSLPVVPLPLGYDPLLQLVHEQDLLDAYEHALLTSRPGVFNVVGAGVLPLSTLFRLARKRTIPLPAPLLDRVSYLPAEGQTGDPPAAFFDYLRYLWVADGSADGTRSASRLLDEGGVDLPSRRGACAATGVQMERNRASRAAWPRRDDAARVAAALRSRTCAADPRRFARAPRPAPRVALPELGAPIRAARALRDVRDARAQRRGRRVRLRPESLRALRPVLDFLFERYWRVDVAGADALPADGAFLLVANHGGLLPYDALMIAHAVERARRARPRFTVADWLIALPFAQPRLAKLGGVRDCPENVERLLAARHSVALFPEGKRGAAKAYRDRYRLASFGRGGAIRTALERRVPLVPVGVVGAEDAHPILFQAAAPARVLGLPLLPITPTFPWLGPLGVLPLPAQWVIRFGEPIDYTDLAPDAARDALLLSRLTEELRERIQALVDDGRRARGSMWRLAAQASAGAPSERID
jgi:1-acyl-sn-glycerol-3-phosphate acyltransferase